MRARRERATQPPLRRAASLRIFVVRCSLPCDPPVGSHSCNGGMVSIARSVPTSRSMDDEWPEDLRAVMAHARTEGCDYLMLDRDGEIRRNPARHLYSVDSTAAFSFASRLSNLSDVVHSEIGAVAITVASFLDRRSQSTHAGLQRSYTEMGGVCGIRRCWPARSNPGWRWPSRLVATAAEDLPGRVIV